jgi:UDP-N-acetylglucosamine 2-epimerase
VKLHIPVAHIEAGLRSYDRTMPEEVNRVVTDHISTLLFAPTMVAVRNLAQEGITHGVHLVGDVRVDILHELNHRLKNRCEDLLRNLGISVNTKFALATIHRASNTDDPVRLRQIVRALSSLDIPVILPIHPRLGKVLQQYGVVFGKGVCAIEPLGYLDMLTLLDACTLVITDSGGLQKEAYLTKRQIITLRNTTEWIETVEAGWNSLCEPEVVALKSAVTKALESTPSIHPDYYGTPGVNQRICAALENFTRMSITQIAH